MSSQEKQEDIPPPDKIKSAIAPPSREAVGQQGRSILVVDDNQTSQQIILRQLTLLGYTADAASNGLEALRRWESGNYALLLTDLYLPEMDGYALAATIRAEEKAVKRIPIIAYRDSSSLEDKTRVSVSGIDECLCKPVPFDTLKTTLQKWLASTLPSAESSTNPNATLAPIDVNILKELVGDDPAVIDELLKEFRIFAAETAAEVKTAYENGQAVQVGALMHKLKSSAFSVGTLKLGDLCTDIEHAVNTGQTEALAGQIRRFEVEIDAVCGYLNSV